MSIFMTVRDMDSSYERYSLNSFRGCYIFNNVDYIGMYCRVY